jgi:rhodanese-related sulfurtransferase
MSPSGSRSRSLAATVGRAVVLTVAGAALGLAVNSARSSGIRFATFETPAMCDQAEAAGAPLELDPAQASELCGRPGVVVADARTAERYAEGHVAGAIHLPCDADGQVASDAFAHLDGARTILVYGDDTAEAQPVAASLRRRIHHGDVRVLRGGFAAWSRAGLACASGPCEECKVARQPQLSEPAEPGAAR